MKTAVKKRLVLALPLVLIIGVSTVARVWMRANSAAKKQTAIEEAVQSAKSQANLPRQIDDVTTWTDITVQKDAIRYHYTLSKDVDTAALTDASLKQKLKPGVCENSGTKNNLERDIKLQFAYQTADSAKTYLATFTKADCA